MYRIDQASLIKDFTGKVNAADPGDTLFPYLYLENIFPAEIYSAIRKFWPLESEMISLVDTGRVPSTEKSPYKNRFVLELNKNNLNSLPTEKKEFWGALLSTFINSEFYGAVLEKFRDTIMEMHYTEGKNIYFIPLTIQLLMPQVPVPDGFMHA